MSAFPILEDPANFKTCEEIDREWKEGSGVNKGLKYSWYNCIKDIKLKDNSMWKDLNKDAKMNAHCCDTIMECNNKNEWLKSQKIDVLCPISKKPDQPHFGDIEEHKSKIRYSLSFGVF